MVCCVLHGWSEHHTANGCAHSGNQFTPILGVIIIPYFYVPVDGQYHYVNFKLKQLLKTYLNVQNSTIMLLTMMCKMHAHFVNVS